MFNRTAAYYDAIYSFKDYEGEAAEVVRWARRYGNGGKRLLEVACGTGRHAEHLAEHYQVIGLDLDAGLLEEARRRLPKLQFVHGDMSLARLEQRFDVITCLFSAIGYLDKAGLKRACANFYHHLVSGGVVLIEPWLRPEMVRHGNVGVDEADGEGYTLVRMSRLQIEGTLSICQFHYLIGTGQEIRHEYEEHRLTLFSLDEYCLALESAGFEFHWDEKGLTERGMLIGVKP